ncbi:hypothetical protein Kpol_529p9 [Vanderwaltozyma polyspora DSM 70294]|uniref:Uncharacterized protein n=1 Tax=Vanderwaltozyma polyspora (strain ATCC 22028 / DSM 70294 / BCRC 21397 / CBS 2163 / NBRC 10782 / NRRL Y-8283 / UCD 57-17) TaxID=436907 RepID=A7TM62_VANPO|nr:uncharacterized protein Kpol_529p9 [Vanderwaltozyma polyspora DSM 70294]EDO16629.1 hypothetical protein Kpol_529p9 [Vanderwaltozyma polyspora DSM 70294]
MSSPSTPSSNNPKEKGEISTLQKSQVSKDESNSSQEIASDFTKNIPKGPANVAPAPQQRVNETSSTNESKFNSRILWPDIIKTPVNTWTFSCKDIIDRLGTDANLILESKKNMEKCLLYFYTLKKRLNLFDHTYTASCILFFRHWYIYNLPVNLIDCINLSQSILVTACKGTENNRPIDAYVKATCEFISREVQGIKISNIDKMKWDIRDKLVENEKTIICSFGFDLNVQNPKEMIEEIFSGYYRYNRDFDLPDNFKKIFPKILQEARNFIVQAVTQPTCLLCDGFTFIALSLIYCGIQYKKLLDNEFKYPKNFFRNKLPTPIDPQKMEDLFTDYRLLEENFFDLKSNKGEKLQISKSDIEGLIDEDPIDGEIPDPYDYNLIKSGEVRQELLDHTKARLQDLFEKIKTEGKKRSHPENSNQQHNTPDKKLKQ